MNEARDYGEHLNAAMIEAVEEARWAAKIRSARALADRAGMTHTYLNQRLNGHTPFSVRDLGALGCALGVPVGDLLARAIEILSGAPDTSVAEAALEGDEEAGASEFDD